VISNKCQYALKAVLELATREKQGCVPISEIAKARDIPARFLEAILRQLKQAGITESVRGKDGGYKLARPASEITMGEIVTLLEGPLTKRARSSENDVFNAVWEQAGEQLEEILQGVTFEQLRKEDAALNIDLSQNYSI